MANDHIGPELQMLLDKQSIRELLATYCRAVDRLDRELLLTVYHPDAIDDHGIFTGCAEGFADWAFAHHTNSHYATQHIITNHLCEIEGDTGAMGAGRSRCARAYAIGTARLALPRCPTIFGPP